MNAGLNREAILIAFMFSTEFQNFMNAALGTYTQRPESGLTMDVYRGMYARMPDSGGFNWWSGQVQSGAMTRQQVIDAFIGSPEWQNRLSVIHAAGCYQ